VSVAIERFCVG